MTTKNAFTNPETSVSGSEKNTIQLFRFLLVIIFLILPLSSFTQDLDLLILNNENDQALLYIDRELADNEAQPTLLLKKGNILQKQYDFGDAIVCYEKAYRIDSLNINILNGLAEANSSLGNFKQALPYYLSIYTSDTTNSVNALASRMALTEFVVSEV